MIKPYDREKAVSYALKWAYGRNPAYYDFSNLGGDCTNFVSQCLYAGSGVMNFTPDTGWYYINVSDRAPAWTGVEFLYTFLTNNKTKAVFAEETDISNISTGDVIQLGTPKRFYHTLIISEIDSTPSYSTIKVCAHTFNAKNRILNSYSFDRIRFLHINGVYI